MSVTERTLELPWSGTVAERRNRRKMLVREYRSLMAAIEAEIVVRENHPVSSLDRVLIQGLAGTSMALSDLDRRILAGQVVKSGVYQRLADTLLKFAAQLRVETTIIPVKAAKPVKTSRMGRPAQIEPEVGVTSLVDYLASKGGTP
jgi:hypothetical protein